MRVSFSKMHGLGNDFMLVNAAALDGFDPSAAWVRRWADRATGVGFDQLLVLEACGDEADFAFRVFNADGSEARQCGNGARCVALFARAERLAAGPVMRAVVDGRVMQLEILGDRRVRADLGTPVFAPAEIPFVCKKETDVYEFTLDGRNLRAGVVSLGNPHAVTQVEALDDYPAAEVGRWLQSLAQFPESVNVGFVQVLDRAHVRLRVFERGAGETAACGSGACAAVVVGRRWGVLDRLVRVTQRGGDLDIEWDGAGDTVRMTGPAEHVYDGELEHD